ncbi:MAG: hypothetical protein ACPKNR_09950 [Pleomorphochaeta sp.]
MKKKLVLSVLIVALTLLSSCSMYDYTSVTIENGSDTVNIAGVSVSNGVSGKMAFLDALDEGQVLTKGQSVTLPLLPILIDGSEAQLTVVTSDTEYLDLYFTYDEGAKVKITFNPSSGSVGDYDSFDIENGKALLIN